MSRNTGGDVTVRIRDQETPVLTSTHPENVTKQAETPYEAEGYARQCLQLVVSYCYNMHRTLLVRDQDLPDD